MVLENQVRAQGSASTWIPALAALLTMLVVPSCGRAPEKVSAPTSSGVGAESGTMSAPVDLMEFSRLVTDIVVSDWSREGRLTSPWTYDATSGTWRFASDGWSTIHVGNSTSSTEIRDQTTLTIQVRFLRDGLVEPDLMTADRASMDVSIRRHHYALDPAWPIADGLDVQLSQRAEFALAGGSADTVQAEGTLRGWADRAAGGRTWRAGFDGSFRLRFDYPDHYVSCPGQELNADIRVLDGGVEIDRYRGAFVAAPDDSRYTGALVSEHGAGRFAIDSDRGCPPPPTTLQSLLPH